MEFFNAVSFAKILLGLLGFFLIGLLFYHLFRILTQRFLWSLRKLGEDLIRKFVVGISKIDTHDDEKPKSLPTMENLILPQILKELPGFDLAMAKNQVRDHLMETYGGMGDFQIHNIVLAEYRHMSCKNVVVFYAAVCWRKQRLVQKRLSVSMEYQQVNGKLNPAINCPNCGATLGFHDLTCKYCGTRINDRRDQEWAFASIKEI